MYISKTGKEILDFEETCEASINPPPKPPRSPKPPRTRTPPHGREPKPARKPGGQSKPIAVDPYLPIVRDFLNAMLKDPEYLVSMAKRSNTIQRRRDVWSARRGDLVVLPTSVGRTRVGPPRETSQQILRRIFDDVNTDPVYTGGRPTWASFIYYIERGSYEYSMP